MKQTNVHTFIMVEDIIYINQEQSLKRLFLNLYFNMRPFSFLERKTAHSLLNRLPRFVIRAVRAKQFVYKFYLAKKKHQSRVIQTDHFGHCLLRLRNGEIKVFNLEEQIVTTVFSEQLSIPKINQLIITAKKASKCSLAPPILNDSVTNRFIKEAYINSSRPAYNLGHLMAFYTDIYPILIEILVSADPKRVSLSKHIKNELFSIDTIIYHLEYDQGVHQQLQPLKDFLSDMRLLIEKVFQHGETDLVLSHGDLWEGNILKRNERFHVIDWTTIGIRSVYYDFYYTMFMLASNESHFDTVNEKAIQKLNRDLDNGCRLFFNKLQQERIMETIKITDQFTLYRYIFYLELIDFKLKDIQVDKTEKLQEVITWISRFKLLEKVREPEPRSTKQ